jgi:hypothetical protein
LVSEADLYFRVHMNVMHLSADDLDPDDAAIPGDLDFLKRLPRINMKSTEVSATLPHHTPKPTPSELVVATPSPTIRRISRDCHERQRLQRMVGKLYDHQFIRD